MNDRAEEVAGELPTGEPREESASAWIRQARDAVSGLEQRSALIYWTDFLLSCGGAWTLAVLFFRAPGWGPLALLELLGSAILFFRTGTFIHEIIHFRPGELQWFRRAWNLGMGIPMLTPWIIYRNHIDHHSVRYFGTPDDGEYLPLAAAPRIETVKYVLQAAVLPVLVVLRFGVIGPLSWFHRGLREWVLTAASHGVSNPYYRKRVAQADERHWLAVEILCFLWLALLAVLTLRGVIGWMVLVKALALLGLTLGLNWVRNLAAHTYGNRGERMALADQFADSINITGQTWLTVLIFPVGLRYHALHHLFPFLPYHNLGRAHRRLLAELPQNSPYRAVNHGNYFAVVARLWRGARATAPGDSAIPVWRSRTAHS
ncbi:MAG TPA: fatty acid desaturase [Steroidobacteraceae bacterium]|nr:fatty acid desaturase [Steroidobacteraceae bacterium]